MVVGCSLLCLWTHVRKPSTISRSSTIFIVGSTSSSCAYVRKRRRCRLIFLHVSQLTAGPPPRKVVWRAEEVFRAFQFSAHCRVTSKIMVPSLPLLCCRHIFAIAVTTAVTLTVTAAVILTVSAAVTVTGLCDSISSRLKSRRR